MLNNQANEIFDDLYQQNNIPIFQRGDVYKFAVKDLLLKDKYGLNDEDLRGLNWKSSDETLEYGSALLKYVDSKVVDTSNKDSTKDQIKEALSQIKFKDTNEIKQMYEKRKGIAINYMSEIVLENSALGLSNASRFIDSKTKDGIALFADKIGGRGVKSGYQERIKSENSQKEIK
jgi:hypothetical protein